MSDIKYQLFKYFHAVSVDKWLHGRPADGLLFVHTVIDESINKREERRTGWCKFWTQTITCMHLGCLPQRVKASGRKYLASGL